MYVMYVVQETLRAVQDEDKWAYEEICTEAQAILGRAYERAFGCTEQEHPVHL